MPTHAPAVQAPPLMHRSSLQNMPSFAVTDEHVPSAGLHMPTLQSSSRPVQSTGVATHTPAVQASPVVHPSPSSQAPPSFVFTASHAPVVALHWPSMHWSSSPEQSSA